MDADPKTRAKKQSGQAMVESILVLLLICFCFFSIFQYASLFSSRLILQHSAACAARARAVGFNEWMTRKSALVASIPAAGKRLSPDLSDLGTGMPSSEKVRKEFDLWEYALRSSTRSPGTVVEANRIPEFMEGINEPTARAVLDYEYWDEMGIDIDEAVSISGDSPSRLTVTVQQNRPFDFSVFGRTGASAEDGQIRIRGSYTIESHYPLYLEDAKW